MLARILGVITLKASTYREIANDASATGQAAIIVVIIALLAGILGAVLEIVISSILPAGLEPFTSPIGYAIYTIASILVSWVIGSWVFAFVARQVLHGKATTLKMLRVFGFAQAFYILAIIPILGLVALVLAVIGAVIGIREASAFSTGKAVQTGIVGLIVMFLIQLFLQFVMRLFGLT